MKNHLVLITAGFLAASGVLQTQAAVISNFEGGSYDGWTPQESSVLSLDTSGATSGSSSLMITSPGGWHKAAMFDIKAQGFLPLVQGGTTVSLDLTLRNDNNQIAGWWKQTEMILNSDGGGWYSLGSIQKDVTWGPTTYNLSWTIPASQATAIAASPQAWVEFFLINNCDAAGATYWIDNVQMTVVPEPASAALLGLGFACLWVIRRRA